MSDITLTRSGELMVTQAIGNTEEGVDFIDAWPYSGDEPEAMYVHDAGNIIVKQDVAEEIEKAALTAGLTVEHDLIASERPSPK
jgi:hypothetical protein